MNEFGQIKILNVDDNEASRYTKSRILRRANFEVKEATTGGEALGLAIEERPNLILLDVNLPDMNGFEVCRRIRTDPLLASTLILQISASSIRGQDRAFGLENGADAYLIEPVEPDELVANVTALLRLRQTEENLRAANERLSAVLNSITEAYFALDFKGRLLEINPVAEQLIFQRPIGELLGKIFWEEYPQVVETGLYQGLQQAIVEEQSKHFESHFQIVDRWFEVHAHPRNNQLEVYLRDITQQKQAELENARLYQQAQTLNMELEQKVQERTAELERSVQELDQFIYAASHDLKAPLRGIGHLASWVIEDAGDVLPETSHRHLIKIQGRAKRMEKLLNDLLVYSRIGRHYYKNIELVDTGSLVKEMIDLLAPPPGFTITVQANMPQLMTHRVLLELVFSNLIDNAIKHHHRPEGRVEVSARELDEFVEFSVTDDGPGIEETLQERVFQVLQVLRPRDQLEGSGMGLAIVKRAIESQGGTINLISAKGEGTTFQFTWPKSHQPLS